MRDLVRRPPAMTSWRRPPAKTSSLAQVELMILAGKAAAFLHIMVAEERRGGFVACESMGAVSAARDGNPWAAARNGHVGCAGVV